LNQIEVSFHSKIRVHNLYIETIAFSSLSSPQCVCSINTHDDATTHPTKPCERETQINVDEGLSEAILETGDGVVVSSNDDREWWL
jgi:hypothetical protein